ncbi:MAG: pyrimidine 5'-nucleotidase [Methylophilaceae bacterium]|nr:pyrimidine 5'-nucleotidase [Methylophilaceae bacterium]
MKASVWIFDLDDTLHNASAHIFPYINRAMTHYIMQELGLEEVPANQLRQHYWRLYGATLKGLMRHHGTDPHHFLHQTHAYMDLPAMVIEARGLRQCLQQLQGRKVVFTNAPTQYALRVLDLLGIRTIFETVFSVEFTHFHPKPAVRGFKQILKNLRVRPDHCIMVEDSLPALMTAKRLGMKTVYVTPTLQKPSYVDARISSVLALPRVHLSHSY